MQDQNISQPWNNYLVANQESEYMTSKSIKPNDLLSKVDAAFASNIVHMQ